MKKIIVSVLVFVSANSAFALCDYEQQMFDKYNKLCDDWGGASVIGATVGAAIGSCILPGVGTLIGGVIGGGAPGGVAKRVCDLKNQKEDALKSCKNNEAWLKEQEAKRAIEAFKEKQCEAAATVIGNIFMKKRAEFAIRAEQEKTAHIEQLLEQNPEINFADPEVARQIELENARIDKKYF